MNFKMWKDRTVDIYRRVRYARMRIRSLTFLYAVLTLSFVPVVLYISVWAWVAVWGQGKPPLLEMLQELRKFIETVFSPAVLAAVTAYGIALVDSDDDGQSDQWQSKSKEKRNDTD